MNQEIIQFERVYRMIQEAKRILVISDGSIDGDSLGSSGAMLNWLKREGKSVDGFCANPIPRNLSYLDHVECFTTDPKIFKQPFDLIMTFDTGSWERAGAAEAIKQTPKGYRVIVFDHHVTNKKFGDVNILLLNVSSTAELVYHFFEANRVPVDSAMATCLLSGIWTDTTHFTNAGTTIKSMDVAGKLLAAGARFSDILRYMVRDKSVAALKLLGIALSHLQKNKRYNLAYTYFLKRDWETVPHATEHMEWIVNFLAGVCIDADSIMVLRETDEGVKGSFRSHKRSILPIAKLLGGGGHSKAAGFMIPGRLKVKGGRVWIE